MMRFLSGRVAEGGGCGASGGRFDHADAASGAGRTGPTRGTRPVSTTRCRLASYFDAKLRSGHECDLSRSATRTDPGTTSAGQPPKPLPQPVIEGRARELSE